MYSNKTSFVFGFHGLDETIGRKIIAGEEDLNPSQNTYDWLGHGVYFWENNLARAQKWAHDQSKRPNTSVKDPFAIGAVIDLGCCFDLLQQDCLDFLAAQYIEMQKDLELKNEPLPENKRWVANDIDFKKCELDCAVIRYAIEAAKDIGIEYDSVRAAFWEGEELYPSAGFKQYNHIQLAILNPDCIKGIFLPRHEQNRV
jgi:hypothetical protein